MVPDDTRFITDELTLRKLHHQAMSRATDKVLKVLDRHCRQIISLSPFCVVATQGPNGADISPRGDPPGFVRELDERTLLLPDRVGNNRLDAMTNLLVNPQIGVLFLVPGMNETLRINGTGRITTMPGSWRRAPSTGVRPRSGWSSRSKRHSCTVPRRSSDPAFGIRRGTSTGQSCRAMPRCCSIMSPA